MALVNAVLGRDVFLKRMQSHATFPYTTKQHNSLPLNMLLIRALAMLVHFGRSY